MIVSHSIETFSHDLASALVEALDLHSDHLRGEKIYGATLVPTTDNLAPWFGVQDDSDTIGMAPCARWAPDDFCAPLHAPRLADVGHVAHELRESWPGTSEEWHIASLAALSDALGSPPVRLAFRRLGADPILYIFDDSGCGIEPTTFPTLNAGRESEPFYRQAARFLL